MEKCAFFLLIFIAASGILAEQDYSHTPSHLYATRSGCPYAAEKLNAGDSVTVVFIGGSITEGGN